MVLLCVLSYLGWGIDFSQSCYNIGIYALPVHYNDVPDTTVESDCFILPRMCFTV